MAKYRVISISVTGKRNRPYYTGEVVSDTDFEHGVAKYYAKEGSNKHLELIEGVSEKKEAIDLESLKVSELDALAEKHNLEFPDEANLKAEKVAFLKDKLK